MSTKINRLSRQKSIMTLVESNPLEAGTVGSEALNLKVENLTAAVLISDVDLSSLLVQLKATESNEERLQILESSKTPHLFSSESLSKLLDITTSVKTRIAIIQLIGPRLTDPRAKTEYFLALFRFAEEKSIVEEVLKARIQSLSSALFNKGDQMKSNIMAGRGGRGGAAPGRGGAGRGAGRGPAAGVGSAVSSNSTAPVPVSIPAVVMSPSKPDSSQITTTTSPGNKHTVTTPVTKVGVLANYLVSDANESPAGSSSNLMESSTMEDVFDMLDKLPLNPNGPAPSSPAKTASKRHQDLQTISENSDDDDDSRANTPFGSTLTLDQHLGVTSQPLPPTASSSSGETKGIALNTSRLAANNVSNESIGSIGPETITPRVPVPVTSSTTGSMPPVSSPAATNTRLEQTPSPVVKTEVVHQTDSLKMILETRSSNRTSIRLEAVESSQTHYHEVENSPARQISNVDTPVATNPSAFSPSSTVAVAAETPQTYDRAAMLRRLDGESDFKSPATSSPRSSGKHLNLTPMGRSEEVNRVLFDSKMSSDSPNSSGKQKLVISSLNSTQKADLKSESGDSQPGDAVSKSESLDDYFALPRTRSFLVATPIEVASSSRSPAKEVEAAAQPTTVAQTTSSITTTTAPVSSMDSISIQSVMPASADSADNDTKRVSPLIISTSASTKSLSSSKVPFAAANPDTPTTTTEEEPTPISFHALRSAFIRGDSASSNLDSNRPPRRHSMVPLSSSSNNIMASVHSAPPSFSREPSSSSPMVSGVTPTRPISRRHSEISISTLAMAESAAKCASNPALFSNDAAAKCAAALNMDKASFLALQVEEGWESSTADGTVARFYSYRELVRRNFCKEYVDLAKSELEKYLSNTEFRVVFAKSKEQFFAQPRWKQMDQKKKALLF